MIEEITVWLVTFSPLISAILGVLGGLVVVLSKLKSMSNSVDKIVKQDIAENNEFKKTMIRQNKVIEELDRKVTHLFKEKKNKTKRRE